MDFFDLPPILYARLDLPPIFIIVRLCPMHAGNLKELHKQKEEKGVGGVKSKDCIKKIRHWPPLFRNSLTFPRMEGQSLMKTGVSLISYLEHGSK